MSATVTPLGTLVMRNESIPSDAAAVPLAPPPFNADTPFHIMVDASPDGCPEVAPGRTVHLHMTGGNIRNGICHLPDYPASKVGDRIAFVETCFQWAPTLKRMTAAARLAFAVVSARRAVEAIGGAAEDLLTRIYDIVEPRAVCGWEGVIGSEIPESPEEFGALVGSSAEPRRIESALGTIDDAFSIGREIFWVDMDDNFGVGPLVSLVNHLAALGLTPPPTAPFLRFPLAAGHSGPEEREHLRHVMAAAREVGYRG